MLDIEHIRKFCLSLPATREEIKWGENLVFFAGPKMFCLINLDAGIKAALSFKAGKELFEDLCTQPQFVPAPYLARARWVQLESGAGLGRKQLETFLNKSYDLVVAGLPKKIRVELGL